MLIPLDSARRRWIRGRGLRGKGRASESEIVQGPGVGEEPFETCGFILQWTWDGVGFCWNKSSQCTKGLSLGSPSPRPPIPGWA